MVEPPKKIEPKKEGREGRVVSSQKKSLDKVTEFLWQNEMNIGIKQNKAIGWGI
jgi:hypothetical protein